MGSTSCEECREGSIVLMVRSERRLSCDDDDDDEDDVADDDDNRDRSTIYITCARRNRCIRVQTQSCVSVV